MCSSFFLSTFSSLISLDIPSCDIFQIFSRSPRGWKFQDLSSEEADDFVERLKKSGIGPAFDHMPYLPNLAAPKEVYPSLFQR